MAKQEEQRWAEWAVVLACMTIAMTILMVIIEKTPLGMLVLLVAFLAYSVYPVLYLTGYFNPLRRKERLFRVVIAFCCLIGFSVWIGFLFWPSPRIHITRVEPRLPIRDIPVINLNLRNDGRDAHIEIFYQVFFVDILPWEPKEKEEMEQKLWEDFKRNPQLQTSLDIANGEEAWTTIFGTKLNQDQIKRFTDYTNGASVYVMGQFRYTDLISERNIDFCALFQNQQGVVPRCTKHNGASRD
jgi:hypothetical protein